MPVAWPSFQVKEMPHAPTSSAAVIVGGVGNPGRGQAGSPRSRQLRHVAQGQFTRSSSSPNEQTRPSSKVTDTERSRSTSMSVTCATPGTVATARYLSAR